MNIWKPKSNGHFINDFKKKLKNKNFIDKDIEKIIPNENFKTIK